MYPEPAKYEEPAKHEEPAKYEEPQYEEPKQSYGQPDYNCKTYYDTEYTEKCVHYNDQVCYTTYQESCHDVDRKKCQGIVTTDQVRQCIGVDELLCGLVETVQHEMVHTSHTVQKCQTIKERVCDTVYEPASKTQDDYQCIKVPTYNCYHKDKTVYEKVCRHETKVDCQVYEKDSYGSDYQKPAASGYGGDSYGNDYQKPAYAEEVTDYSYDCKNKTSVNCYDTPRVVKHLVCTDGEEKVCEKFPEKVPSAVEKQNCHDEDKKVCEMEVRKQPKQVKKYVYKKQCRKVPRQICSSADVKRLVPQCTSTSYKSCDYQPSDKCEHVPQKYCFNVPRKIKKTQCEASYAAPEDKYQSPTY